MKLFIIVLIIYFSSANATPEFEGRGGEELASEISNMLLRVYGCLDLQKLCIIPKQQCWVLYIDILVRIYLSNYYFTYQNYNMLDIVCKFLLVVRMIWYQKLDFVISKYIFSDIKKKDFLISKNRFSDIKNFIFWYQELYSIFWYNMCVRWYSM